MPEISRFFGIVIKMFFDEHLPSHFHVEYNEDQAVVDIRALTILNGRLSPRVLGMVVEWASEHQPELVEPWQRAANHQALFKISPLK